MKHGWGWSAAIALLAMTAAHAQSKESARVVTSESIVKRVDRSGDGTIDYEEYRNAMMRRFATADSNGDGVLNGDEIPRHSLVVENSKATVDEVKRDDYNDALQPLFDSFDADHDGLLVGDEIEALAQARRTLKEAKP